MRRAVLRAIELRAVLLRTKVLWAALLRTILLRAAAAVVAATIIATAIETIVPLIVAAVSIARAAIGSAIATVAAGTRVRIRCGNRDGHQQDDRQKQCRPATVRVRRRQSLPQSGTNLIDEAHVNSSQEIGGGGSFPTRARTNRSAPGPHHPQSRGKNRIEMTIPLAGT